MKDPSALSACRTLFNDMAKKRRGETKRASPATSHHMVFLLILEKKNIVLAATHGCFDLSGKTRGTGRNSLASGVVIIIGEKRTIRYTTPPIDRSSKRSIRFGKKKTV